MRLKCRPLGSRYCSPGAGVSELWGRVSWVWDQLADAGVCEGVQWGCSARAEKLQTEFNCSLVKALLLPEWRSVAIPLTFLFMADISQAVVNFLSTVKALEEPKEATIIMPVSWTPFGALVLFFIEWETLCWKILETIWGFDDTFLQRWFASDRWLR